MTEDPDDKNASSDEHKWGSLVAEVPSFRSSAKPPFRLELIRSSHAFWRLLEGFEKVKAVTYVAEARSLLDFYKKLGCSYVEVVLGESFSDTQNTLDAQILEQLCSRIEDGTLRVYVPKKTIHSKMYILERPGAIRVIHGSRNLYPSGSWDSVAVFDLQPGEDIAQQFIHHYDQHMEGCSLFLGDILEQMRREPERKHELIEAYLQRGIVNSAPSGQIVLQNATRLALENPHTLSLNIELPKDSPVEKEIVSTLASLNPIRVGDQLVVPTHEYLGLVEKVIGMPIMAVDLEQVQLRLVMDGEVRSRITPPPSDRSEIDKALDHLERYLATADMETASKWDREAQKAGMFEGVLYVLSSPFFHELMKIRHARFGLVDRRGPLFLMIYGRSSNGKTTFLQFALKLLAGKPVSPLAGKEFRAKTINRVNSLGTVFPLVFDDIPSVTDSKFGEIIKSYWEKRWVETNPVPQLVFSTNTPTLRDWARTRVKKIVFPVYFQPTSAKKQALHQLLLESNAIFEWFGYLLIQKLRSEPDPTNDDLALAREVFRELYDLAGRPLPAYFPQKPVDQIFSTGRLEWQDLIYGVKKASIVNEGSRIRVEFTKDMQREEVSYYEGNLPLGLNKDRKGNTILIYSPDEFKSWLAESASQFTSEAVSTRGSSKLTLRQRFRAWHQKEM